MCCYLVSFQTISFPGFIFRGRIRRGYLPQEFEGFSLKKWEGREFFFKGKEPRKRLFEALDTATYLTIYPDYDKGQIKVLTVSLPKIDHIYLVLECKKEYPFQDR